MLTNKQELKFFSVLGLILGVLLIFIYIFGSKTTEEVKSTFEIGTPKEITNVQIKSKAAFVYDVLTKKTLFAKNENLSLPLASLTKMMSALVAVEMAPSYSTIVVSSEAIKTEGDAGLMPGESWSLKNLLDFSLVSSANDGMRAVALTLGSITSSESSTETRVDDFVKKMNSKAEVIGMNNTYYMNDTGLDISKLEGGAYGSAKDQAVLMEYILKNNPTLLSATKEAALVFTSKDGFSHIALNTSSIVNEVPGLIASKTGFTDLAGGNLVIAFDPEIGRPIIISVLGGSEESRFEDVLTLVDASLESIQSSVVSNK
ncbi:MAG: D-alanyl-D-alanine carboxypeptidase family protein [Minisyncoccota bacterium]